MNLPFVSIIIVSWNALHHLKRFLPSVIGTNYPEFEIIFADNASTDDSVKWVRETYPEIQIQTFDSNYGYCGGNNRGATFAKGEIFLFLNNDVEVEPDWLNAIAQRFKNPEIGAVQPKIRSYLHKDSFEYAGAAGGFIDYLGYPFCRGRLFDSLETDLNQYNESSPIFWASGAALAIRKSDFEALGGFDESFEFHMEEIDLCWRLWKSGKQVWYESNSIVYHLGGGSLNASSPRKTFYNFRNNWWMLMRNLSADEFNRIFLKRLFLDSLAFFKELITGRATHASAIFRGLSEALLNPRIINQKSVKLETIYPKSIIWEYFVKRKKKYSELILRLGWKL